jgi:hypothetical protein
LLILLFCFARFSIILERLAPDHIQLVRIWVLPDHQDKKIGHAAMNYIHIHYPAKKWTLETPPYAYGTTTSMKSSGTSIKGGCLIALSLCTYMNVSQPNCLFAMHHLLARLVDDQQVFYDGTWRKSATSLTRIRIIAITVMMAKQIA